MKKSELRKLIREEIEDINASKSGESEELIETLKMNLGRWVEQLSKILPNTSPHLYSEMFLDFLNGGKWNPNNINLDSVNPLDIRKGNHWGNEEMPLLSYWW